MRTSDGSRPTRQRVRSSEHRFIVICSHYRYPVDPPGYEEVTKPEYDLPGYGVDHSKDPEKKEKKRGFFK